MRRALQLIGLCGSFATGLLSTQAFAQEGTDTAEQQPAEAPKAEASAPAAPAAPAVEVAAPAAPVVAPAGPKVGDTSVHGYFRGGWGASSEKGRQVCFQLPLEGGLLSKYRLGNECEVWAEMEFTTVVYAGDDGVVGRMHFMPTAFIPTTKIGYSPTGVTSSDLGSPGTGATVAFPNLYVDIQNIPGLFGGTAWAGTRYYKRESIYINDFFYWNPSGVGAGIEDVRLGKIIDGLPSALSDVTISYGAFAVDGQPTGTPSLPLQYGLGMRNDLQVRGFRPLASLGGFFESVELQLGFQYIWNVSSDHDELGSEVAPTHGGWGTTAQLVFDVLGGNNKAAVQYGKGGGTGFGTLARFYYPDFSLQWDPKELRIRALDVLTIQPFSWLGAQADVVYQYDDMGTGVSGAVTKWYSAGERIVVSPVDHLKLIEEVGYDRVQKSNGLGPQTLTKATGAIAVAGGRGFWGRPEIRFFYTWALWNENARGATIDSYRLYTTSNKLSGWTLGVQGEAIF